MKIQGWEHTAGSHDRDLRRQLADQARQIHDLESRPDHVSLQRDHLRQSNDHLFQQVRLAGSEIDGLHTRVWDLERELADATAANTISEESLRRMQEEMRFTQEEVVTNTYVGSIHGGSTRGSTHSGSPLADQDSAPPDQASRDLAQARSEVTRLSHDLRVARESIARLATERDQAQHDRSNVTAERDRLQLRISDLEVERDNAIAEWGVATRKQTELDSSIRDLSTYMPSDLGLLDLKLTRFATVGNKLKTARDAADTLNRQVAEIQGRHDQLAADHDRTFRQHDDALRQLAAVAETPSRPIRVPGARSIPVSSAGASDGGSGSRATASGSLDQASSGFAIPAAGSPGHGSGSSAFTSPPASAPKPASPGPRSSGGDAAQTPAKRPRSGSTSSDAGSFRTRKQPRAAGALRLSISRWGRSTMTVGLPERSLMTEVLAGTADLLAKLRHYPKADSRSRVDLASAARMKTLRTTKAMMTSRTPKKQRSPMSYWRRIPGVLSLNRDRRPVADLTPLPLVILPVDRGGGEEALGGPGDPDDGDPGAGPSESAAGPAGSAGSGSPAGGSGSHPS
ncbi:hypothetical protein PI124_g22010 [Phytophthora idaei]|nr:hypothetical protein PI124_g22010 [Phytophthora idaei]